MGFFAPWFLAGIAAVGLPVWIHLLKKHRTDPRLFPSLMLFEKREQSSVKHRRLDYIVLFLLRAAMLVLLALLCAAALPVIAAMGKPPPIILPSVQMSGMTP